ncbi:hypothetical protein BJV77DRAFT_1025523 [Russula vinacea]|nr:hypothetical protein BJV77DRAFT_1025523 [Russula vinacea]
MGDVERPCDITGFPNQAEDEPSGLMPSDIPTVPRKRSPPQRLRLKTSIFLKRIMRI